MGILDDIGDLAHHAYDTVSGALSSKPAPKAEASAQSSSDWVERSKQKAQSDRNKSIDDQVSANE